ncbi:hypothetical protein GQ607_000264 [Colletotrichum asianum]|uniref:Uncharacterized protein n=1 Tax=Colletotrichum asianum TaxID=702518 RepID=A0A8H3WQA5_9PEZI|nr:hypothetical protein GQ607_000264 [Colletotrichum asianum]
MVRHLRYCPATWDCGECSNSKCQYVAANSQAWFDCDHDWHFKCENQPSHLARSVQLLGRVIVDDPDDWLSLIDIEGLVWVGSWMPWVEGRREHRGWRSKPSIRGTRQAAAAGDVRGGLPCCQDPERWTKDMWRYCFSAWDEPASKLG